MLTFISLTRQSTTDQAFTAAQSSPSQSTASTVAQQEFAVLPEGFDTTDSGIFVRGIIEDNDLLRRGAGNLAGRCVLFEHCCWSNTLFPS